MKTEKIPFKALIDTPQMHILLSDIVILDAAIESRRIQIMRSLPNLKVIQMLEKKNSEKRKLTASENDSLVRFYMDADSACLQDEKMGQLKKKRTEIVFGEPDPLYKSVLEIATEASFTEKDIKKLTGTQILEALNEVFLRFKGMKN
jgi:hypothetical protein